MEPFAIAPMSIEHYGEAYDLWRRTEGIGLSATDSREATARYLERNPGLCFVALAGGHVVGTVMCGFDGRRGYLTHLAVDKAHRRKGFGRALVERAVDAMVSQGIIACNLFVLNENVEGRKFWESMGWIAPDYWGVMNRKLIDG